MTKTIAQLFEDSYANIMLGSYKLSKQGQHQEAYDEIGHVLDLLMEARQELRKSGHINVG